MFDAGRQVAGAIAVRRSGRPSLLAASKCLCGGDGRGFAAPERSEHFANQWSTETVRKSATMSFIAR
jgi:hypothetical protein